MTDPFFMLVLIENLGPDYVVWDKSASIRFKKPGSGTVSASFRLADQQIDDIRQALKTEEKIGRMLQVEIRDELGVAVAEVQKLVHIRKKDAV
jgi:Domain of unknown function (DUF4442)